MKSDERDVYMDKILGTCPVCQHKLSVTRLYCESCQTAIEGTFGISKLGQLPEEHQQFIEVFVKARGNIKEVEKELGISYPTVRKKLNDVITALGYTPVNEMQNREEILDAVESGQLTAKEAATLLKQT